MNYQDYPKEKLVERIEELEILLSEIKQEKEENERLKFAWSGNLGNWYWDIKTNHVTHNPLKVTTLGYTAEEIPEEIGFEFFTEKLHPDDYEPTMENMRQHLSGKIPAYEVEYRIRTKAGNYRWYKDIGKVTRRGPQGEPLFASGIVFDITERKELQIRIEEQNKLLHKMATTDGLTQVLNHQAIHQKLDAEIQRAKRYKTPLSIIMADLDYFKSVNDTFGHLVGDAVLQQAANIIQNTIRTVDFVGRYGGEEFLIILPNICLQEAAVVAERLRKNMVDSDFEHGKQVTISGGVCQYEDEDVPQLFKRADQALYLAKQSGRNCFKLCQSD